MNVTDITDKYVALRSIKAVSDLFGVNRYTIRKILIVQGLYVSDTSVAVNHLAAQGKQLDEIAKELGKSPKTVWRYMPYCKGSYILTPKSDNALRIAKCRDTTKSRP